MQNENVLICSSDQEVRSQASEALKRFGPEFAENAEEVQLKLLEARRPSLLILDMESNGMTARETVEAVRRIRPSVPVISIEENSGSEKGLRFWETGGLWVLIKPLWPGLLEAMAERILEQAQGETCREERGRTHMQDLRESLYGLAASKRMFEALPVAAMVVDAERKFLAMNREAKKLISSDSQAASCTTCGELLQCTIPENRCPLKRALERQCPVYRANIWTSAADRSAMWIERISPFTDPKTGEQRAVLMFGDTLEHLKYLSRLRHQARTDPVTGVGSQSWFEELWSRVVKGNRRSKPQAVLMASLEGVKDTDPSYESVMGDLMLRRLGQILLHETRNCDIVARLEGSRFVVYCPGTSEAEARKLADRILGASAQDHAGHPDEPLLKISIGLASSDDPATRDLLKDAEAHLHLEKNYRLYPSNP